MSSRDSLYQSAAEIELESATLVEIYRWAFATHPRGTHCCPKEVATVAELKQMALDHTANIDGYVTSFERFLVEEAADRVEASQEKGRTAAHQARDAARAAGAMRLAKVIRDARRDTQHLPVASGLIVLSTVARRAIAEADPTIPAEAAVSIYAIRLIHVIDDWRVYVASLGGNHKPLHVDFPPDPDEI